MVLKAPGPTIRERFLELESSNWIYRWSMATLKQSLQRGLYVDNHFQNSYRITHALNKIVQI